MYELYNIHDTRYTQITQIMAGGLLALSFAGANDLFLTGSPEITFFKSVYRRYTLFAKENVAIPIGNIDFGKTVEIEIEKIGDLISNTYIQLNIPAVQILTIDTATDLTSGQYTILTTPYPSSLPSGSPNYITDYALVTQFMAVNMAGYRKAVATSSIINQTVTQYIQSIMQTIIAAATIPEIIQNYDIAIANALSYEISKLTTIAAQKTALTTALNDALTNTSSTPQIQLLQNTYNTNMKNLTTQYNAICSDIAALDYTTSDIYYILNNIMNNINNGSNAVIYGFINPSTVTIATVLQIVTVAATQICQKVVDYYFKNSTRMTQTTSALASPYAKFAWTEKLGHAIIDYVQVTIGGDVIDKHYGDWLDIWYSLTTNPNQDPLYNKMIGNVPSMTTYSTTAKPAYTLYIPLSFWFCRKNSSAFPLIALQYNKVYITIKLKKLEDCAYIAPLPTVDQYGNTIDLTPNALPLTDIWSNLNMVLTGNLLIDYIYLDKQERRRFAQSAHEYLLDTIEYLQYDNLVDVRQNISTSFTGPSKELIWMCRKDAYTNNYNSNLKNLWFNYGTFANGNVNAMNPFLTSQLTFGNGTERFSYAEEMDGQTYFNYVQPYAHHTRSPPVGINTYSFALFPEDHQPSGTCNFTRIPLPTMNFTLDSSAFLYYPSDIDPNSTDMVTQVATSVTIYIYSIKINVFRIAGGMGSFAFY